MFLIIELIEKWKNAIDIISYCEKLKTNVHIDPKNTSYCQAFTMLKHAENVVH